MAYAEIATPGNTACKNKKFQKMALHHVLISKEINSLQTCANSAAYLEVSAKWPLHVNTQTASTSLLVTAPPATNENFSIQIRKFRGKNNRF